MDHLFLTPKSSDYFKLDLSTRLGRGATASVYKVNIFGKYYAVKIYNKPDQVDWAKISAMTELGERDEYQFALTHAWPVGLIQKDGENVGFAMPLYDLGLFKTLDHYYDNLLRSQIKDTKLLALPNLVLIAKNLCIELEKLHKKSIYLVDIKPQNIVVNTTTNEVVLLDCDGFSIEKDAVRYPASLISADYIAPEVTINKLSPKNLGLGQDLYGLSVLIFQILNRGLHPFSGKLKKVISATTNDDKAALGYYAYGADENPNIAPHVSSLHSMWPSSILAQLESCFTSGERASASEWISIFDKIERNKGYIRCDKFQKDHLHIRFRDQDCMQCKIDNLQQTHSPIKSPVQSSETVEKSYIPPSPPPPKSGSNTWIFLAIIGFFAFIIFAGNYNDEKVVDASIKLENTAPMACSNDNTLACNNQQICEMATFSLDGTRNWKTNQERFGNLVDDAKRRNLTCGVRFDISCSATDLGFCSTNEICNAATYPTARGMRWSLTAESIWVNEAKRRDLSCGVVDETENANCNVTNLTACSSDAVCRAATAKFGDKVGWVSSSSLWFKEAKRRRLNCGVGQECAPSAPSYCTDETLCSWAATNVGQEVKWSVLDYFAESVMEAKRRNLTCGVGQSCSESAIHLCSDSWVCSNATIGVNTKTWGDSEFAKKFRAEADKRKLSCGVRSSQSQSRFENMSILGNDLVGKGYFGVSEDRCIELCRARSRCEAISYQKSDKSCWLKPTTEGLTYRKGVNTVFVK